MGGVEQRVPSGHRICWPPWQKTLWPGGGGGASRVGGAAGRRRRQDADNGSMCSARLPAGPQQPGLRATLPLMGMLVAWSGDARPCAAGGTAGGRRRPCPAAGTPRTSTRQCCSRSVLSVDCARRGATRGTGPGEEGRASGGMHPARAAAGTRRQEQRDPQLGLGPPIGAEAVQARGAVATVWLPPALQPAQGTHRPLMQVKSLARHV